MNICTLPCAVAGHSPRSFNSIDQCSMPSDPDGPPCIAAYIHPNPLRVLHCPWLTMARIRDILNAASHDADHVNALRLELRSFVWTLVWCSDCSLSRCLHLRLLPLLIVILKGTY